MEMTGNNLLKKKNKQISMNFFFDTFSFRNVHSCWIYLLKRYPAHFLGLTFLTEYTDSAEHPYIIPSLRKKPLDVDDF